MGNERASIGHVTGLPAQRHFERGQRTDHAEPRLHDNHADCCKMRDTKPPVANPGPVECPTREYQDESRDDEGHEQGVKQQHCIGGQ